MYINVNDEYVKLSREDFKKEVLKRVSTYIDQAFSERCKNFEIKIDAGFDCITTFDVNYLECK